jgi:hypothetical protein
MEEKYNLENLKDIDTYINADYASNFELKTSEMIGEDNLFNNDMKLDFVLNYAKSVYEGKPILIRQSEKYVSKKTIKYIDLFLSLNKKNIEIHKRLGDKGKEILEKTKIGGDFILNIIPKININQYLKNGKNTTVVNSNKSKVVKSNFIYNKDIRTLQNYENLLESLKSF